MLEKDIASQDEDHFITVDAVGCFEGDEEEEEEEEDEEIEVEEEFLKQVLGVGLGGRPESGGPSCSLPGPRPWVAICEHECMLRPITNKACIIYDHVNVPWGDY
jgi:hypothetical protein